MKFIHIFIIIYFFWASEIDANLSVTKFYFYAW